MSRSRITKMPGKRVHFDQETWNALDLLAMDSMRDFHELGGILTLLMPRLLNYVVAIWRGIS